jgi:hypothetical protein
MATYEEIIARGRRRMEREAPALAKSIVKRRCFKKWCHKSYRSVHGWPFVTYTRVPTDPLRFTSPMVNDENQELCGGWFPDWLLSYPGGDTAATIDRVRTGLKPMGFVWQYIDSSKAEIADFRRRVSSCRFHSPIVEQSVGVLHAAVWQDDRMLREMFDLHALAEDYTEWVDPDIGDDVWNFETARLADFTEKWDVEDGIPLEITGLILGYPIENTISLMHGGIK